MNCLVISNDTRLTDALSFGMRDSVSQDIWCTRGGMAESSGTLPSIHLHHCMASEWLIDTCSLGFQPKELWDHICNSWLVVRYVGTPWIIHFSFVLSIYLQHSLAISFCHVHEKIWSKLNKHICHIHTEDIAILKQLYFPAVKMVIAAPSVTFLSNLTHLL